LSKRSNNSFWTARWVKRRYYIEDGYIKPIAGSRLEEYDPFTYHKSHIKPSDDKRQTKGILYLEFANLDLNDDKQIESFVNKYGLLGLYFWENPTTNEVEKYFPQYPLQPSGMHPRPLSDPCFWDYLSEPIELFRSEISTVQNIIKLHHGTMKVDLVAITESLDMLAPGSAMTTPRDSIETKHFILNGHAYSLLTSLMNAKISRVRPIAQFIKNDEKVVYTHRFEFSSLIDTIYFMLHMDMAGIRPPQICAKCKTTYIPGRKASIYCSTACAKAEVSRRQRVKKKKSKEG